MALNAAIREVRTLLEYKKSAIIYLFTINQNTMFKGENYHFKNSSQITKYLTGTGCKAGASELFSTRCKNFLQACYCFRFNYYHSLRAITRTCFVKIPENVFNNLYLLSCSILIKKHFARLNIFNITFYSSCAVISICFRNSHYPNLF